MRIYLQAPIAIRCSSRLGRIVAIQTGLLIRSILVALYIWVAAENYDKLTLNIFNRCIEPIGYSGRILETPVYVVGKLINSFSGTYLFNQVPVRLKLQMQSIAIQHLQDDVASVADRRPLEVNGTLFLTKEFGYHMKLAGLVYFFLLNLLRYSLSRMRETIFPSSP